LFTTFFLWTSLQFIFTHSNTYQLYGNKHSLIPLFLVRQLVSFHDFGFPVILDFLKLNWKALVNMATIIGMKHGIFICHFKSAIATYLIFRGLKPDTSNNQKIPRRNCLSNKINWRDVQRKHVVNSVNRFKFVNEFVHALQCINKVSRWQKEHFDSILVAVFRS